MTQNSKMTQAVGGVSHGLGVDGDEISLVELWLILARHRRTILVTTAVVMVLAGLWLWRNHQRFYSYTTIIEIGTRTNAGRFFPIPIESPAVVLTKLRDGYIPQVLAAYALAHLGDKTRYHIEARQPKGNSRRSPLIKLVSQATKSQGTTVMALEESIAAVLQKGHSKFTDRSRSRLELNIKRDTQELNGLIADGKVLKAGLVRQTAYIKLLKKQRREGKFMLMEAFRERKRLQGRPLPKVMVEDRIERLRALRMSLQHQFLISLPAQRDNLELRIADNARKQELKKQVIATMKSRVKGLQETRVIVPPRQSPHPVGVGRALILVLGLFAGLALGVLIAFGQDFFAKIRVLQAEMQSAEAETGSAGQG